MKFLYCIFLFAGILLAPMLAAAQAADPAEPASDKEKARKESEQLIVNMVDQAVGDVGSLRLAQNRAMVFALAGDIYWKFDEKRARQFFRSAADEIITNNNEVEKEKKDSDDPYVAVFDVSDMRSEILPIMAARDADLALQLLVQTRSPRLAEAVAKAALPATKQGNDFGSFDPDRFRVQNEIALEQRFALLAAEQNPDRAIKLIKDSLAKGLSWNVMPLLQKLNNKDNKKATELAGIVVQKVLDTDLTKKRDDLRTAISFLQSAANPNLSQDANGKRFAFSDTQISDIANKVAATLLQPGNSLEMATSMTMALPSLEKLLPEKALLLKQRQAEMSKNLPPEMRQMQTQQKLWNPSSTPEEILAELPKLNEMSRAGAYQSLTSKIAQIPDEDRAKRLIEQIPDEKVREKALDQYESAKIGRTAATGNLDAARKMISSLTKRRSQVQKLVSLAIAFKKKDTEKDTETAVGLMRDAKALVNESPEDEDELNDLMEVVKGYAIVDPVKGFRLFEPIVDQINDFVQASAILSKYNKRNRSFRKGELVMRTNYTPDVLLFRYTSQMQLLAKADLNRMNLLSDRFQRADARTFAKLVIAQGFLKEESAPQNSGIGAGVINYVQY
jgi:hypothetical protein